MANKKNNRKPKKVEVPVIEIEETITPIEVEKPIVEIVEKDEDKGAEYEVILARPSYYIINKNGRNITIKEINNYKKGDKVIK